MSGARRLKAHLQAQATVRPIQLEQGSSTRDLSEDLNDEVAAQLEHLFADSKSPRRCLVIASGDCRCR